MSPAQAAKTYFTLLAQDEANGFETHNAMAFALDYEDHGCTEEEYDEYLTLIEATR